MFDFILIYIVSALILAEISIIYHEESWSNKALKISFIPIKSDISLKGTAAVGT